MIFVLVFDAERISSWLAALRGATAEDHLRSTGALIIVATLTAVSLAFLL